MSYPLIVPIPRVAFLDKRTGDVTREWRLFFLQLVNQLGGANGASIRDLMLAPGSSDVDNALISSMNELLLGVAPPPATFAQDAYQPPQYPQLRQDVYQPPQFVGTLGEQNADRVKITGGTINLDAGNVGAPSFTLGANATTGFYQVSANNWGFSISGTKLLDFAALLLSVVGSITVTSQLKSTVGSGTPPLVVNSTTEVANLNVAQLKGRDWDNPGPIGSGTADIGNFTDVLANVGSFANLSVSSWGGSVTGSRGGNAALASLLTLLDGYGIIDDNTTP